MRQEPIQLAGRHSRWILAGVLLLPLLARAADEERYEVRFARSQADGTREFFTTLDADSKPAGEFFQDDLIEARQWLDAQAAGWEKSIALYKEGKEAEARKEFDTRARLAPNLWKWRVRLERRRGQADISPTEAWFNRELENLPAPSLPLLEAWCEARKAYAASVETVAKAWRPDSTDTMIREAEDKARLAQTETEIAELRYRWSRENAELIRDRNLSPDMNEKVTAVQKSEDQLIAIRRDRALMESKNQQIEQQRRELLDAARRAREAAIRAREAERDRVRNKKP